MRRTGTYLSALSAANAWSSQRPDGGRLVRAIDAGFLSQGKPIPTGSERPE
jgi:hypothetical protein